MANVNVRQVNGGEVTVLKALHSFLLDDGINSNYIEWDSIVNLLVDEGVLINGYVSVSVSSSDLIVAIKTWAGSDPSSTNPAFVKVGGTLRAITAATSITLADATNWFNSGATETATKLVQYFTYIGYRASDSSVFLGFSRKLLGRTYASFSTTNTTENYLAYSGSAPASSDVVVPIGRFSATLSATATFTWSISGTGDVVNYRIFETDWLDFVPSHTGFSVIPTGLYQYKVCVGYYKVRYGDQTVGTSNATSYAAKAPFTSDATVDQYQVGRGLDNGAALLAAARVRIPLGTNDLSFSTTWAGGGWAAVNGKGIHFSMDIVF